MAILPLNNAGSTKPHEHTPNRQAIAPCNDGKQALTLTAKGDDDWPKPSSHWPASTAPIYENAELAQIIMRMGWATASCRSCTDLVEIIAFAW